MPQEGENIVSGHRNLAYMLTPTVMVAKLSKTTGQRLMHWGVYPGQFRCAIMRIGSAVLMEESRHGCQW